MKNSFLLGLMGLLLSALAIGCGSNPADSEAHQQWLLDHDALESEHLFLDSLQSAFEWAHDTLLQGESRRNPSNDSLQKVMEAGHRALLEAHQTVIAKHDSIELRHRHLEVVHSTTRMLAAQIEADHLAMIADHDQMVIDHERIAQDQLRIQADHDKIVAARKAAAAAIVAAEKAAADAAAAAAWHPMEPVIQPAPAQVPPSGNVPR